MTIDISKVSSQYKPLFNNHGQIVTTDWGNLYSFCQQQPVSSSVSLNAFVAWVKKNQRINFSYSMGSYGLKHQVEQISDLLGKHEYIANDELIVELIRNGCRAKNTSRDIHNLSPNYYFNIPKVTENVLNQIADSIDGGHRHNQKEINRDVRNTRKAAKFYKQEKNKVLANVPENLRKRLDLHYGLDHAYVVSPTDCPKFLETLKILVDTARRMEYGPWLPFVSSAYSEQFGTRPTMGSGPKGAYRFVLQNTEFNIDFLFNKKIKWWDEKYYVWTGKEWDGLEGIVVMQPDTNTTVLDQWMFMMHLTQGREGELWQ